jgi:phosphatidylinositol glycan class M
MKFDPITNKSNSNLIYVLIGLSAVIHAVLIFYGMWRDQNMRVAYTDVDYWVYSDAASHVYNGRSSFDRHTYRYTPLLAWLLVPNEILGGWWGKALFSLAGVSCGWLIYRLTNKNTVYASLWLFSPLTINISTRGSSDSLIVLLILLFFHEMKAGRLNRAAVWFGLSVHLRIFPIFFVVTIIAHLRNWRRVLKFAFVSGAVCVGLIGLFYLKDGYRFIYEAYLYHFARKDHRHNFSLFYYAIYLSSTNPGSFLSRVLTFSGFLPQIVSLAIVGVRFGRENFMFAVFLQTVIFVAFNKVITAQYFLWYFGLFPVALHAVLETGSSNWITIVQIVLSVIVWGITEVFWLKASYRLEVQGENNFLQLLAASVSLFAAHVALIVVFVRAFIQARASKKLEPPTVVVRVSPTRSKRVIRKSPR